MSRQIGSVTVDSRGHAKGNGYAFVLYEQRRDRIPPIQEVETLRALATQCMYDAADILAGVASGTAPRASEHQAVWSSFDGSGGPVIGVWGALTSGPYAGERLYRRRRGMVTSVAAWLGPDTASDPLKIDVLIDGSVVGSGLSLPAAVATYKVGRFAAGYSAGGYLGLRLSVVGAGTLDAPVSVAALVGVLE